MVSKSSFLIKIDQRSYVMIGILCYLMMGFLGLTFFLIGYLHQLIIIRLISLRPGFVCCTSNCEIIYAQRGSFLIKKHVKYGAFLRHFCLRSSYGNQYSFFLIGYYPEFD